MKIYLACLPSGCQTDVIGYALCEDGHILAQHLSSNEMWSKHDMGYTSRLKHDIYIKHTHNNYQLEWVEDTDNHKGWLEAIEARKKLIEEEERNNG
ncbi:MAG TPA: hypothetical protein PKD55_01475 [Bellilinea sp.]|nr:hypothetical protein [Bellilinea sp.]